MVNMVNIAPYAEARPFWKRREGELRLQRCADCERAVFYPRRCPYATESGLSWFTSSGTGTVYSCTVAHRSVGEFAGRAPYSLALIDLDEGPRMMSRIAATDRSGSTTGWRSRSPASRRGHPVLPCFRVVR